MYKRSLVNDPMFNFIITEQIEMQSEMKSVIEKLTRLGRDGDAEIISQLLALSEEIVSQVTAEEVETAIASCDRVQRYWDDYPELMSEIDEWVENGDIT
jgi:hypothetical protein